MLATLLFLLILFPMLVAVVIALVPWAALRSLLVVATGAVLTASSILLLGQGPFTFTPQAEVASGLDTVVMLADFALLGLIFYFGAKRRSLLVQVLAVAQLVPLLFFELFYVKHEAMLQLFRNDQLSTLLVLVVSIIGSLICIFALPYMRKHEEHLHLEKSRQPQFFFFLVLFLGAMNGLVLSNSLAWMYFFFEITTFCSFMLIGHDATEEATANSVRALWMNSVGGVSFVLGMILAYAAAGTMDVQAIIASGHGVSGLLLAFAFLCLAGMIKAAQVPFQSWLLGAMVAPTPVSALLHSSTMVKAGVFMVMRFAPAFAGTFFSTCLAMAGAFTFLVTMALALGQSNGKRILAYSTISNLGLIVACAGLNTPVAIAAGLLMILFHAISKGLLFLCVGTIEQEIGSRDIEDMRSLFTRMPRTAIITVIGIVTMLLPPFGVLLAKWMALEASAANIVVVVMVALGSAIGVVVWGRWAGILMSTPYQPERQGESQDILTQIPLTLLAGGAVLLSLAVPVVYTSLVKPMLSGLAYEVQFGGLVNPMGAFVVYPLFLVLALGFVYAMRAARKARDAQVTSIYLGGAQTGGPESKAFVGPMNVPVSLSAGNYYLASIFGEGRLTSLVNLAAIALLVLMVGGALR